MTIKKIAEGKSATAKVITTIVSALYFGGHLDNARGFMKMTKLCPNMLDKSRFCRRLHNLDDLVCSMFFQLGQKFKMISGVSDYIIDSLATDGGIPVEFGFVPGKESDVQALKKCHWQWLRKVIFMEILPIPIILLKKM